MIPLKALALEEYGDYDSEYCKADNFLNHFELHQREGAAVNVRAYAVGRNLQAIFEEGYSPGKQNHQDERPAVGDMHLLQLQVAIPRKGHTNIGAYQQNDGPNDTPVHYL